MVIDILALGGVASATDEHKRRLSGRVKPHPDGPGEPGLELS
jgi:hypothetical protein